VHTKTRRYLTTLLMVGFLLGCLPMGWAAADSDTLLAASTTKDKVTLYQEEKSAAINTFMKEGKDLLSKGKYVEAKVKFEKALKLDPENAEAKTYLQKCDEAAQSISTNVVPSTQDKKAAELKAKEEAKAKAEAEKAARLAAEAKAKADAEAQKAAELAAKKEAETKAKAAAEARKAAELKAKEDAKLKAEADKKAKLEAEAKAKADAEAKKAAELKAKDDAKLKAEAAKKAQLAAEAKAKAAAEAKAKLEAEAKKAAELKAKEDAKLKAEADKKAKLEAEAKDKADAEAKKAAEKAKLEAEAKAKAAAEAKAKLEAEAKKAAELKAKEDAKLKAEADKKAKLEAEAKAKADAEAKAKAEAELKKAAELKAKKDAEAKIEAEKRAKELEALRQQQIEAQKKAEAAKAKAEADKLAGQIKALIAEGKSLYQSGKIEDLDKAKDTFEQVLTLDPGNKDASRYLSLINEKIKKAQEAEEAAKAAQPQAKIIETNVTQNEVVQTAADNSVSTNDQARAESIKKAEAEEARFRAEKAREDAARTVKLVEEHYKAGIAFMNQGQVLKANEEWNKALELNPDYTPARTMITETQAEYLKALEVQRGQEELAKIETENDARMKEKIITIDVTDQEIGDVLTQMGAVAGFNVVIGEGVKAKVSASFANVSLKDALDNLLPQHGFKYVRNEDIIQVAVDLKTRIFQLTDEQVKRLRYAMVEDKILQRQIYGSDAKPKVAGQEMIFDERSHILTITDSQANITKVDEFLKNLPAPQADELIVRVYTIRTGSAEEVRKLVQSMVDAGAANSPDADERKVILEQNGNTLVVKDTAESLKKIEEFLIDRNFLDKLTNQELLVKVFHLSTEENIMTPEALARKAELVNNVGEVIETMLYTAQGREQAYEEGRRIYKDARTGTITVIDNTDNLRKVEEYIAQLPTGEEQQMLSRIYTIKNADPNSLRNVINQILQESRGGSGGGQAGSYVTGVISVGAGNGLVFMDCTVELNGVEGDTTTPSARLYIYTPLRDREVTLAKNNSELVDNYRIRVTDAWVDRQEAEIEIRLASFAATNNSANLYGGNYGTDAFSNNMMGQGYGANPMSLTGTTNQNTKTSRAPSLRVDNSTNNIIVLAYDPKDLQMIDEWIKKLDVAILQVTIEAKFVEVSETRARKLAVDWLIPSLSNWGSLKPNSDPVGFGRTVNGSADPIKTVFSSDPLISDLRNNNLMAGGVQMSYEAIGGLQVALQALEADGVVNVINSPRITALNGEEATLTVTQSIPWMSYEVNSTATSITWETDSVIIELKVKPTIHQDGSVILDIEPRVDKLVGRAQGGNFNLTETTIGSIIPGLQTMYNTTFGRPIIDTRNLTTRARVSDGGTIVLGGLIQETDKSSTTKVPLLGDVPFIKYLFRRTQDVKDKNRLFIFLTATIVP